MFICVRVEIVNAMNGKILSLLIALAAFSAVHAAAYNFGTMQGAKVIKLEPGEEGELEIYFFNIHGDRITHVTLDVTDRPTGWETSIDPPLHNQTVDIQGGLIQIQENLYAEPLKTVPEKPAVIPEGMDYRTMAGVEGFVLVKIVKIKVKVPEDAELWKSYGIVVKGVAEWYGEGGMVALNQVREFSFTVNTVKHEYTETIVTETSSPPRLGLKDIGTGAGIVVIILALIAGAYYIGRRQK